jgi:CheY-like chemotaxis protein
MSRILMWVAHEPLREVLADVLRDAGHLVDAATSRRDALGRVAGAHGEADRPHVVLVDGDEDGVVIARAREHLPDVPIVVLSSSLAMDASGDVHLDKPFSLRDLLRVIESALGHAERAPPTTAV